MCLDHFPDLKNRGLHECYVLINRNKILVSYDVKLIGQ